MWAPAKATAACLVVAASSASAQPVITVPDRPSCASCRIVLERVARIDSTSGGILLSSAVGVAADENGIVVVDSHSYPGQLLYRSHHDASWTVFGRKGEGPGEFTLPGRIWLSEQGIHVSDLKTGRETVFDRSGRFVETYRLPALTGGAVPLANGRAVHTAIVRTRAAAGYPLHLLDGERTVVRSFGTDTAVLLPGAAALNYRVIAPAAGGAVWAARANEYRIEKWDTAGSKLLTIRRDAPWFQPWIEQHSYLTAKPSPVIVGISEDGAGYLWVLIYVPPPDYKPLLKPGSHVPITEEMRHQALDTRIEVIDPRTARVVARGMSDSLLWPGIGPMMVGRRQMTPEGALQYDVLRLRLVSTSSGR